ncbi:ArsR family transcriptional regulator, partial [Clostridium perfringens]
RTRISLRMQLNAEQYEEMTKEFRELLEKWVTKTLATKGDDSKEYAVGINVVSTETSE